MNISIQEIDFVLTLATTLNFKRAAEQCHTSQPNLSVQLKKVERELGVSIFERSNRSVAVTEAGKLVISHLKKVKDELELLRENLQSQGDLPVLKMGLFPTLAPYYLPHVLKEMKSRYPNTELKIVEGKTADIVQKLLNKELDCICVATPIHESALNHHVLFNDPFYVAISTHNPILGELNGDGIEIDQLKSQNILLLEEGHCLRDQSMDFCFSDSLAVNTQFEYSSLETLKAIVAANDGVTFVPKICIDQNPQIAYIPILGQPYTREIGLFWRKRSPFSAIMMDLATKISL